MSGPKETQEMLTQYLGSSQHSSPSLTPKTSPAQGWASLPLPQASLFLYTGHLGHILLAFDSTLDLSLGLLVCSSPLGSLGLSLLFSRTSTALAPSSLDSLDSPDGLWLFSPS